MHYCDCPYCTYVEPTCEECGNSIWLKEGEEVCRPCQKKCFTCGAPHAGAYVHCKTCKDGLDESRRQRRENPNTIMDSIETILEEEVLRSPSPFDDPLWAAITGKALR